MRIVSPGIFVPSRAASAAPSRVERLGPLTGRLVSLGWTIAFAGALFTGSMPSASARALALVGVLWGIAWGRLDWSRRARWSSESLAVVAGLHAVAAMVALDVDARVSWPFFAIVAALGPRLLPRRHELLTFTAALALAPLAVSLLAPGRAPESFADALVASAAIVVIAFLVARRPGGVLAPQRLGDVHLLHAKLAERVAADPERFALLAMDASLAGALDSDDFVIRYDDGAHAIVGAETDRDGARLLAMRLERAVAELHRAPAEPVQASVGIAVYPEDGRTADELLDRLDEYLRIARAARRPASVGQRTLA